MKIAYTIVTADLFAHAITLGNSLTKYNPDYVFIIGLLDKRTAFPEITFPTNYAVIEIEEIKNPYFQEMNERYTLAELAWSSKPFFGQYIEQTYQPDILLYFDSDIVIFHDFAPLETLLEENAILLTPHTCTLIEDVANIVHPNDAAFIKVGIFNSGFVGLNTKMDTSKKFLQWWKERLVQYCLSTIETGYFGDQKWLNLAVILFEKVHIVKHLGCNVAHFNLHERTLNNRDGQLYVNNEFPLIFYHYSGYDWKNPALISKHHGRYTLEEREDLRDVLFSYSQLLIENKVQLYSTLNCFYGTIILARIKEENEKRKEEEERLPKQLLRLEEELKKKTEEIQLMRNSKAWKISEFFWAIKNKITR